MVLSKKRISRKVLEEIIRSLSECQAQLGFSQSFWTVGESPVMLSAQTTDAAVNKATPGLCAFPTVEAMAVADVQEISRYISRLGLYRNKAKFLKECAQQL